MPSIGLPRMDFGNMPTDGGNLFLMIRSKSNARNRRQPLAISLNRICWINEFINGNRRFCIWVERLPYGRSIRQSSCSPLFGGKRIRLASNGNSTREVADTSRFNLVTCAAQAWEGIDRPASFSRKRATYLPAGLVDISTIISDQCFAIYDDPLWNMAIIASPHALGLDRNCLR